MEVVPEDLAVIQYTGGTTAQSKGVMLSHRNLVANALQTRHWLPDAVEGRERFLCVVPIFHSYGLTTALECACFARRGDDLETAVPDIGCIEDDQKI